MSRLKSKWKYEKKTNENSINKQPLEKNGQKKKENKRQEKVIFLR